jgi:hypothetical protein
MRPKLPPEIERMFPSEVLHRIYQFVPHEKKESPRHSPTLQKELTKLQNSPKCRKSAMYMKDLDDFCL